MGRTPGCWLLVAGWPARVSGHCQLGAPKNVGPKSPQTTHSVPAGWAEASSKSKHPAPPGAAKGRLFCLLGGVALRSSGGLWGGVTLHSAGHAGVHGRPQSRALPCSFKIKPAGFRGSLSAQWVVYPGRCAVLCEALFL